MKKRALFIVLFLAALLSVSAAMADRPVGGLKPRIYKYVSHRRALCSDGEVSITADKSTYEAGESMTFSVKIPEGYNYTFAIAVFDGTYEDSRVPDTVYELKGLVQTTVSYNNLIWTPGNYAAYVELYEGDIQTDIWVQFDFTVTQCSGINQLNQIVSTTVSQCIGNDDFETLINIHNWVLSKCTYDEEYHYYSAESLFLLGTGVCNSYARAFDLLLKAAGIPSRRIAGYAFDNYYNGHAWNAANIDGKWHLYDCTWEDTESNNQYDPYWNYRWCGLPDDLMFDHTAENYIGGSVTCSSMENNYFVRSGAWQEQCGEAASQMETQLAEGLHRFSVETGLPFDGDNPEQEFYINNRIAAAGLSATVWTDIHGDACQGTFTAEMSSPTITGQFIGSGLLTLPSGTETLEEEAFAGTAANYVVINDGCTKIASGAFRDSKVWEITIPESVTNIEEGIFSVPGVLIITPANSPADNWAKAHNYPTCVPQ